MPLQDVDTNIMRDAKDTILAYEQAMATTDFHKALEIASDYIRQANKYWSAKSKAAIDEDDADGGSASIKQVLANAFYMLRIAIVLMHPIAPAGTKLIFEHLNLDIPMQEFTSWEHIFSGYEPFVSGSEYEKGGHPINEIPPRFDFF
jgi:methionyl-tRNA synthetase